MSDQDQEWEIRYSNSRSRPYFYSITTKESRWEPPSCFTPEQLLALPGAEHLSAPPSTRPKQVRASHLLIKHAGSRKPASWKEKVITRSKEEAIEILKAHQKSLNEADDLEEAFARVATTESDCSSAKYGGDLGTFGPKQMQKPFEDATFATEVGKMSEIVDTDSGVHLILRTG